MRINKFTPISKKRQHYMTAEVFLDIVSLKCDRYVKAATNVLQLASRVMKG